MTTEQLSHLPDYDEATHLIKTLPNGTSVEERKVLRFIAHDSKPDDVFMFTDNKGSWTVMYNVEGGPYKRRI